MANPKPARMQHMALEVSDTDRSIAFYRDVLGFKLTERHAPHEVNAIGVEITFLRLGDKHHDLVLIHNPNKAYTPRAKRPEDDIEGPPSFHHIAFEYDTREDWLAVHEVIDEKGVEIARGPVLHSFVDPRGDGSWGENEATYIFDPDGHRIELFCNLASIDLDGTHINADGERVDGTSTAEL